MSAEMQLETEASREIAALMDRARAAQAQIADYSQEQVDELIRGMVWAASRPGMAEQIARQTIDETQLGNYDAKYTKIAKKTRATLADIIHDKSVGVIEVDEERNIIKIAKPMGVVGALSTSTHPEATPVIKAIQSVKGRNAIIIAPHPRAKHTNKLVCDQMRHALEKLGAPADLVIPIEFPTLETTQELMRQCDVIHATGGKPMVQAAYSSGTPALGVGVGNAVITVDDTADLSDAAEKILASKTFDEGTSCSSDNAVVAFDSIYDELLEKLIGQGGYLVAPDDTDKLAKAMWQDGILNRDIVAQKAARIGEIAGIEIPAEARFIIVPETGVGADHPFSGEKLSVIMALYRVADIDEAIALTNRIQAYQGLGHSCGLYTSSDENILRYGSGTKTSRVMINQPQSTSNSGALWNGMRQTFSLGCGSWGGNSTNDNINWRNLVNITWISKPLAEAKTLPDEEELFGDVIAKIG